VSELVAASAELGVERVVLSDTVGVGQPDLVSEILQDAMRFISAEKIGLHMHDTYQNALDNCAVGLDSGINYFDASAGGTGGCPFAPGASGNLATGALFDLAKRRGCAPENTTLEAIDDASHFLSSVLGKDLARGAKLSP
jgi:hydroxymethylglutaryl-CoA lyase